MPQNFGKNAAKATRVLERLLADGFRQELEGIGMPTRVMESYHRQCRYVMGVGTWFRWSGNTAVGESATKCFPV